MSKISKLAPGRAFEYRVKALLESDFDRVQIGEYCRGSVGVRPHECDLHASRDVRLFQRLQRVFYTSLVATLVVFLVLIALPELLPAQDTLEIWAMMAVLAFCGLWHWSTGRSVYHVWVECKNRGARIKRDDINKLHVTVEDVRAFDKAAWKPTEVWFVSTSEYDQDALTFAAERRIVCFKYEAASLRRVV